MAGKTTMRRMTRLVRSAGSSKPRSVIDSDRCQAMMTLNDRAAPACGLAPHARRRPALAAVCLALAAAAALPSRAQADSGAGTTHVAVDAREAPRGIMSAHLVLPV